MTKSRKNKIAQRIPIDRCHLYGLRSPHALASRLGWDINKLDRLAADGKYRVFRHKSTGRSIQEPGPALQSLHRQLHRYLARIEVPGYLHSAVKGKSYVTNARAHVGDGSLVKIDIAKFYQSVPQHKVMHFFRDDLNCGLDVAGFLANLICFNGVLATGSAISPIISYFAYRNLFDEIAKIAERNDLVMTCYVDDITLSGVNATAAILHEVRTAIFKAGLRAHKDKHFTADRPRIVTGVVAGKTDIALPFARWRTIRNEIREFEKLASVNQRLAKYPSLVSRLYEATQIDPQCRRLAEYHHQQWRLLKRAKLAGNVAIGLAA